MGNGAITSFGRVRVLPETEIFQATVEHIESAVTEGDSQTIGLTGGSTPKRFYDWVGESRPFSDSAITRAVWSTSDERMVPLEDGESNFGEADRRMLTPLRIAERCKFPWATGLDPHSAASAHNMRWNEKYGPGRCFDLCLLGMGDDGHTASIFPESPLLGVDFPDNFTCVEVPGKGWRLSITRAGFSRCREILITVTGEGKAQILREVLEGPANRYPVQLLAGHAERTTWLIDPAAASKLSIV